MSEVNQQQPQQTVVAPDALPYIQQGVAIENQRVMTIIKGLCCMYSHTNSEIVPILNMISGKALTTHQWDVEFGFIEAPVDPEEEMLDELTAEYHESEL